jgi:hypothetical protein
MAEKGIREELRSMIEKIELSAEIARISLACPNCNGLVRNAIQRFKDKQNGSESHPEGGSPLQAVTATNPELGDCCDYRYSTHRGT